MEVEDLLGCVLGECWDRGIVGRKCWRADDREEKLYVLEVRDGCSTGGVCAVCDRRSDSGPWKRRWNAHGWRYDGQCGMEPAS